MYLFCETKRPIFIGMKPSETSLPNYTRTQEKWNCYTHLAGVAFALIGGPFLIAKAFQSGDYFKIFSSIAFVVSLLILYSGSALYHGWKPNKTKRILRVFDHNNVFILIMGTYAPYCLSGIRPYSLPWAYSIFGLVITLGIVGIVLNSIDLEKFKVFSLVDYILMGWTVIISFTPLVKATGIASSMLLLAGGISYTIGAVLYVLGKKKSPWWHTVFHVFCLLGTSLMFFSIYFFII